MLNKQINLRSLAARALPFCLTISISVLVDQFMFSGLSSPDIPAVTNRDEIKLDTTLIIKSVPEISFPESLSKLDGVDFWIIATADLDSDGLVKNIYVNFLSALSVREQSFMHNILTRVNEKQSRLIMRELAETLVSQLAQIKFEPKVKGNVPVMSHVVVSTHFSSCQDGPAGFHSNREIATRVESDGAGLFGRDTILYGTSRR